MTMNVDVITREVIRGGLEYIAEEMGIILRNAAYSTNIKERMDHSCALFDYKGRMLAQAEHIPVHLGAMPIAVKSIEEKFAGEIFSCHVRCRCFSVCALAGFEI